MNDPRAGRKLCRWTIALVLLGLAVGDAAAQNIEIVDTTPKTAVAATPEVVPSEAGAPTAEVSTPATPAAIPAVKETVTDVTPVTTEPPPASAEQSAPLPVVKEPKPVKLPPASTSKSHGYYGESSFHKSTGSTGGGEWLSKTSDFYQKMHAYMGDRFHIGLRVAAYALDEHIHDVSGEDPHYLGSIDEFVDVEDTGVIGLTLGFYPIRNFGIEYRHEKVQARAFTDSGDNHPDGNFVLDGPIILAVGRLPLDQLVTAMHKAFNWPPEGDGVVYEVAARFIPYIGIGTSLMDGSFDADTWWGQGFASPVAWEKEGMPSGTTNGKTRQIHVVGDNQGTYYAYGITVRLADSVWIDFNQSRQDAELEAEFYLFGDQFQDAGIIPMSYTSTSVGIRYYF